MILAFKEEEKKVNVKDTILITTLSWPVMIILSSLPFYFDINCEHYIDAVFEATSGLTTTGATVYQDCGLNDQRAPQVNQLLTVACRIISRNAYHDS